MKALPSQKIDLLAIGASSLCAVHCMITPFALVLLAQLHGSLASSWKYVDVVCLLIAPVLAFFSLSKGYAKHRQWWPCAFFLTGLSVMLYFVLFLGDESPYRGLMVMGGLLVVVAHVANLRLSSLHQETGCC